MWSGWKFFVGRDCVRRGRFGTKIVSRGRFTRVLNYYARSTVKTKEISHTVVAIITPKISKNPPT